MIRRNLSSLLRPLHTPEHSSRLFSKCPILQDKHLPARLVVPETEITESFLKGSGPGGQKINKTSSAVQLKHLPTGIVVKCQATRSREQNRKTARKLLAEKVEEVQKGDESRTAIKAERARVKKASADKKRRRKYRKLAEEKAADADEPRDSEDCEGAMDVGDVNEQVAPIHRPEPNRTEHDRL